MDDSFGSSSSSHLTFFTEEFHNQSMPRKAALLVGVLSLFAITIAPVSAHHREEVLGFSTAATDIIFPPVSAGPGHFLPDSPLYALDKAFQSFRLAVAFTPERRVVVRNLIFSERLAELRVMTERGNEAAIQKVLHEMASEANHAAADLADAEARGKDVVQLAKDTNDLMRLHRETLRAVAEQADDALALQVESARQSILIAKMYVEDQLSEQELAEAIENDLEDEIDTQVLAAETRVEKLAQRLDRFDKVTGSTQESTELEPTTTPKPTPTLEELRKKKQEVKDRRKQILEDLKARKKKAREERRRKMREARQKAQELRKKLKELRNAIKTEKNGGDLSGFTIADCGTEKDWKNHGEYVSCVAKLKQKGKTSEAARSDIGKKNSSKTPTPTITPLPTIVVE